MILKIVNVDKTFVRTCERSNAFTNADERSQKINVNVQNSISCHILLIINSYLMNNKSKNTSLNSKLKLILFAFAIRFHLTLTITMSFKRYMIFSELQNPIHLKVVSILINDTNSSSLIF
jgi:hypothetical protein